MIKTRLLKLMGSAGKYVVLQIIWQMISLLAQFVIVLCTADLIRFAVTAQSAVWKNGGFAGNVILSALIVIAVCVLVRFACDRLSGKASFRASADVKRILRNTLYEKMLRLGVSYREKVSSAEVLQMSVEGVEQLETYFGKYISQFFYALIAPVVLFFLLRPVNHAAALVLLICVPLLPVVMMAVQIIAKKLLAGYWKIYAGLGDSFLENIQGLTTLKIHQADGRAAEQMDAESETFRKVTMKVLTMQLNSTLIMDLVAVGGAGIGIVVGFTQYFAGAVDLAGMIMIILLSAEFFLPMRLLGSYFHIGMNGMAASDKIFAILDLPEEAEGREELAEDSTDIRIRDLHFSYSEDAEVLHGIDLEIPAGSFTGIVGKSGCGKSTIAKLLAGRNRQYQGQVTIGRKELSEVSAASLMRHVTYVPHAAQLFRGTVRDNLQMGCSAATDEEMLAALQAVHLKDFLLSQKGLETEIAEKAANLSGGQAQRLALARAFLHDSAVYIFDEATSNIDVESEAWILEAIHRLAGTKTVIMISHRLANVVEADQIFLMEDGRITEQGTHASLLAQGGSYCGMFREQKALESYASGQKTEETQIRECAPQAVRHAASAAEQDETGTARQQKTDLPETRRPALAIMKSLIRLVRPVAPVMVLAAVLGIAGFLCAIFVTTGAGFGVMMRQAAPGFYVILLVIAFARGVLHCGEQYCNHYVAFRILALIRHKVFAALRRLAPAKLETREKGNLISMLTSDIELLEVFFAHTISPIAIGAAVSLAMTVFIAFQNLPAGILALAAYLVIGLLLPVRNGKRGVQEGIDLRNAIGDMNSFVLESLYGLEETVQYAHGPLRARQLDERSAAVTALQRKLSRQETAQRSLTSLLIQVFSVGMLVLMLLQYQAGAADADAMIVSVIAMMSSFGPVVALSNLSGTLNQTLASGERVLSLLEEEPQVEEVMHGARTDFAGAALQQVSFSYGQEPILKDCSMDFPKGRITGIHGASGSGKSTILKLLMRFWDADSGTVSVSGKDVRSLETSNLRGMEGYVTQETWLFHDTIAKNIALGRPEATRAEIEEAAKKAAIHDTILTLPGGYDTKLGELGESLSGGERQRLGIARAFLYHAPLLLLDEPTSNLDAINEGIILKSLKEHAAEHTIVLVSHRRSTLNLAEQIYTMETERVS